MSDIVQQELSNVLQALDGGFARMTRVFKSMKAGEVEEGFEKLARLSRGMQRSVRQALQSLDPDAFEALQQKKRAKQEGRAEADKDE
jgi:hypothetical protein